MELSKLKEEYTFLKDYYYNNLKKPEVEFEDPNFVEYSASDYKPKIITIGSSEKATIEATVEAKIDAALTEPIFLKGIMDEAENFYRMYINSRLT